MVLTIRVDFPTTYPVVYKNVRLNDNLTVSEACQHISTEYHLTELYKPSYGLFNPETKSWLPEGPKLKDIDGIFNVASLQYKDKEEKPPEPEKKKGCTIL